MSSLTHHHNKKTGVTYVYSVESYWDKKKKAPRNRQVCIGKLDKATGEIIPTQRKAKDSKKDELTGVTAETRIAGPALLLAGEGHRFDKYIKSLLPQTSCGDHEFGLLHRSKGASPFMKRGLE